MKRFLIPVLFCLLVLVSSGSAFAQAYYFELTQLSTDVYINSDGSTSLYYLFSFKNDPSASPIEYVDVGMPDSNFSLDGATARVNGEQVRVSRSDYEGNGSGFSIVLGSAAIPPGWSGDVEVFIPNAGNRIFFDDQNDDYASVVFSPTWFGSQYVNGTSLMQVTFHLPPGIQSEEPRWHAAPNGWPEQPETGLDADGRITYTWGAIASATREYEFGASFPSHYIPGAAIVQPSIYDRIGISADTFFSWFCCASALAGMLGVGYLANKSANRRKMQYLPPKVAIEGLGIKRGLTAVEAAILMEQPLDKVLTMILFGVLKKGAASVKTKEPLTLDIADPLPQGLLPYEEAFLTAFVLSSKKDRQLGLQTMTIDLVKSISEKMKGFSRKETQQYYRTIIEQAWKQVETAETPAIKSEVYDKNLEWTMLDKDYDDRTREVFQSGPVYVPNWWGRYDPTYSRPISVSKPASQGGTGQPSGGGVSLPTLPGSSFAASVVNSVQNFSAGVIGNVSDFTSSITNKTNPVPVVTSSRGSSGGHRSGGGGGCACACACACAGCACACAGGGR